MAFKKIGIIGATGLLGPEVTRALIDEGFEVVPFSRQDTKVNGIPTQKVSSFKGFDVIISVVGDKGWHDQLPLIAKAKEEGVKRFIPSEFGMDHRGQHVAYVAPKEDAMKAVQEAGFPDGWTGFINGFFENVVDRMCKWDLEKGEVMVTGKGSTKYPFVYRYDIGRAIATTLKNSEKYKDQWVLYASDWVSGDDMAKWVIEAAGKDLKVKHVAAPPTAPIITVLEESGGNVFDKAKTTDLGIKFEGLEKFVKSKVK